MAVLKVVPQSQVNTIYSIINSDDPCRVSKLSLRPLKYGLEWHSTTSQRPPDESLYNE